MGSKSNAKQEITKEWCIHQWAKRFKPDHTVSTPTNSTMALLCQVVCIQSIMGLPPTPQLKGIRTETQPKVSQTSQRYHYQNQPNQVCHSQNQTKVSFPKLAKGFIPKTCQKLNSQKQPMVSFPKIAESFIIKNSKEFHSKKHPYMLEQLCFTYLYFLDNFTTRKTLFFCYQVKKLSNSGKSVGNVTIFSKKFTFCPGLFALEKSHRPFNDEIVKLQEHLPK